MYTIDKPSFKAVGLIGANSPAEEPTDALRLNLFNFIFPYEELSKDPTQAHFYGSYSTFTSWSDWMAMNGISGNVVSKFTAVNFRSFAALFNSKIISMYANHKQDKLVVHLSYAFNFVYIIGKLCIYIINTFVMQP